MAPLPLEREPALGDFDALYALVDARSLEDREADLNSWLDSAWK